MKASLVVLGAYLALSQAEDFGRPPHEGRRPLGQAGSDVASPNNGRLALGAGRVDGSGPGGPGNGGPGGYPGGFGNGGPGGYPGGPGNGGPGNGGPGGYPGGFGNGGPGGYPGGPGNGWPGGEEGCDESCGSPPCPCITVTRTTTSWETITTPTIVPYLCPTTIYEHHWKTKTKTKTKTKSKICHSTDYDTITRCHTKTTTKYIKETPKPCPPEKPECHHHHEEHHHHHHECPWGSHEYHVGPGDYCYKIAQEHGSDVHELRRLNPWLDWACSLYPGNKLCVPDHHHHHREPPKCPPKGECRPCPPKEHCKKEEHSPCDEGHRCQTKHEKRQGEKKQADSGVEVPHSFESAEDYEVGASSEVSSSTAEEDDVRVKLWQKKPCYHGDKDCPWRCPELQECRPCKPFQTCEPHVRNPCPHGYECKPSHDYCHDDDCRKHKGGDKHCDDDDYDCKKHKGGGKHCDDDDDDCYDDDYHHKGHKGHHHGHHHHHDHHDDSCDDYKCGEHKEAHCRPECPEKHHGICDKWHKVCHGDTCSAIWTRYGITEDQLRRLNPWLNHKCEIYPNEILCVGGCGYHKPGPLACEGDHCHEHEHHEHEHHRHEHHGYEHHDHHDHDDHDWDHHGKHDHDDWDHHGKHGHDDWEEEHHRCKEHQSCKPCKTGWCPKEWNPCPEGYSCQPDKDCHKGKCKGRGEEVEEKTEKRGAAALRV